MRNIQDALYKGRKVTLIENLIYGELGQAVLRLHNERFKGTSLEIKKEFEPNKVLAHSNIGNISFNERLRELGVPIHVLSPEEMVIYWKAIKDPNTYTDSDSLSVYPNPGPNEDRRQEALSIVGIQNPEQPYLVSGIDLAPNGEGYKLVGTDHVNVRPAHFLIHDCRVKYDPETKSIVKTTNDDQEGIQIYTSQDQSGLRGAFRVRSDRLDFGGDDLLCSSDDGRVQVLCEPQAHTKNLEAKAV